MEEIRKGYKPWPLLGGTPRRYFNTADGLTASESVGIETGQLLAKKARSRKMTR